MTAWDYLDQVPKTSEGAGGLLGSAPSGPPVGACYPARVSDSGVVVADRSDLATTPGPFSLTPEYYRQRRARLREAAAAAIRPRKEEAACCISRRDIEGRLPIGFCSPECVRRPARTSA